MNTQHIKLNIPLRFEQVVDCVKQLSPKEKNQLIEVLLTDPDMDEITEEQKEEVRQRIKRYQDIPNSYLTWDDIEHKLSVRK
jgi:putative addiction module component (TIGR02574 family)